MIKKSSVKTLLTGSLLAFSLVSSFSHATVVEIRTSLGPIQVNLFDNTTPKTVANFLSYVNSGAYVNNVVHRVESNFVVQAGGFNYSGKFPELDSVATGTPVQNEPKLSNLRGTIAMAKLGGSVNSATSQWFFSLANNSANLDVQNGGFTVFGQVIGDGMQVVDAIAAVNRFNAGGALASIPIRNYTTADANNNVAVTENNLVIISDIVIIDATVATHPEIVPANNTLINSSNNGGSNSGSDSGGGGSFAWLSVLALIGLGRRIYRS
ncbi:peptidylprolyl isomerase [Paraglaciecola hydrolytica]|uniref:Peptidyl-prolyl cis-trans isomerase n=1 Tax=Paraglaciecola hydrolytica TaxID=1799789 RepID=A0A136A286_9ALTE|nr:peptidylprolyl isomerase [Paraglaciecola hydrolytica]KXI29359.1 peptidylprolyl isomerase [Paraglaciecola hydrolytica]